MFVLDRTLRNIFGSLRNVFGHLQILSDPTKNLGTLKIKNVTPINLKRLAGIHLVSSFPFPIRYFQRWLKTHLQTTIVVGIKLIKTFRFYCLRADVSYFLCCTRKRDVYVTPSLIVFQRPAGFPRSWKHAVIDTQCALCDLTLIGCYRMWSDNVCGDLNDLCKRGFLTKLIITAFCNEMVTENYPCNTY